MSLPENQCVFAIPSEVEIGGRASREIEINEERHGNFEIPAAAFGRQNSRGDFVRSLTEVL